MYSKKPQFLSVPLANHVLQTNAPQRRAAERDR
jgi:hypothetical protein